MQRKEYVHVDNWTCRHSSLGRKARLFLCGDQANFTMVIGEHEGKEYCSVLPQL